MKSGKKLAFAIALSLIAPAIGRAADEPKELLNLIRTAEKVNAGLSSAQIEEKVSEAHLAVRKGDYLPSLQIDAADSWGYPGSSGSMGIPGLAGSPYRDGTGVDLLLAGTVWDFGRTAAQVQAARHLSEADKAATEIRRGEVDRDAISLYFECARDKSLADAWAFVEKEASRIDREVERLVANGQRSVVDKFLARAQVEQAETAAADYDQRLILSKKRLEILTRGSVGKIERPDIDSISEDRLRFFEPHQNPVLRRGDELAKAAASEIDRARADYLPRLKAYAAIGTVEDSHVVATDNYAVGVGIVFPLFDGFKTVNGVRAAEREMSKQDALLAESRYELDQGDAGYDRLIGSSRARLDHIQEEVATMERGFSVARNRYFSLQGTLVDLREALRNLAAARADLIDTKTELFTASLEKQIFNGGRIKR